MFKSIYHALKHLALATEIQSSKVVNESIKDYATYKQNNQVDPEVVKQVISEMKTFRNL